MSRSSAPSPVDPDVPDEGPGRRPLHLHAGAVVLVFLGGALGTYARFGLAQAYPTRPQSWPTGTFVANLAGAFVLGLLLEALSRAGSDEGVRQRARLLGGTGFCGGFTTYSTLAVETDLLLREHCPGLAIGYLAATAVAGIAATVLGIAAATRLVRAR